MELDERLMDLILPRGSSPLQLYANTWGEKNDMIIMLIVPAAWEGAHHVA